MYLRPETLFVTELDQGIQIATFCYFPKDHLPTLHKMWSLILFVSNRLIIMTWAFRGFAVMRI